MRQFLVSAFKGGFVAFVFVAIGLQDGISRQAPALVRSVSAEIVAIFSDPESQWTVFLYLGAYCAAFLYYHSHGIQYFWRFANPHIWLVNGLIISAVLYFIEYVPSVDVRSHEVA